jgi:hypothetical protein
MKWLRAFFSHQFELSINRLGAFAVALVVTVATATALTVRHATGRPMSLTTILTVILLLIGMLWGLLQVAAYIDIVQSKKSPHRPPGSRLISFADFLFSKKINEQVFLPLVADWRTEYFEALKQGRTIKARWISIRYTHSFLLAMGISKVYSAFKGLLTLGRAAGK